MQIYLDMVSTEAPRHAKGDGPRWRAHAARLAMAFEPDRGAPPVTLVALVATQPEWPFDPGWVARYLGQRATQEPGEHAAQVMGRIADQLAAGPSTPARMVAHAWSFHREVFNGLRQDAGLPALGFADGDFYDVMHGATNVVRLPLASRGGFKVPKLSEAFQHFAGAAMLPVDTLCWRAAALQQLHALRTVYWGIHGWGAPVAAAA